MFLWLLPAITAGSAIYKAFKGRGGSNRQATDPRLTAFDAAATRTGRRAETAEKEYLRRVQSFDPMAAATAANQAQYNMVLPQIQQAVGDLRGAQAATGRLRSGFGTNDQDKLMTDNLNNLNQSMIARAMDATRMSMDNTAQLGGYAMDSRNMYMDATLGRAMTDADREAAERASKRGMWGGLLGAGIGAFGDYAGRRWGQA